MGPTLIVCAACGWPTLSDVFMCGRCGAALPVPPPPEHLLAPEDHASQNAPTTDPWAQPLNPWHTAQPPEPVRYSHDPPGHEFSYELAAPPPQFWPEDERAPQAPQAWPEDAPAQQAPQAWPEDAPAQQAPHAWPEGPVTALAPDQWPTQEGTAPLPVAEPALRQPATVGPEMWPTHEADVDPWARPAQIFTPADIETAEAIDADADSPGAVVGMMPSMSVFTEMSSVLSAEAESERRWQAAQAARVQTEKPQHFFRNAAIIGLLLISLFAGYLVLQRGSAEPVINSNTPVDKLPWRDAEAPSGKFRIQLPTTSTASPFTLTGFEGELLVAKLPNGEVRAASFAIDQTVGNQTAFLQSILEARADQLFGAIQTTPVKVRWGLAVDGTMDLGSKSVAIRASMVGSTLYLVEAETTGTSDRLTSLFERATATFVPTENN